MKIALIGYGKMGKAIEKLALDKGHEIVLKINSSNLNLLNVEHLAKADVAIEFSKPSTVINNIRLAFEAKTPIVVGTTGWNELYDEIVKECKAANAAILSASNFSIGVNLFFQLNTYLAKLMEKHSDYKAEIEEVHHLQKLDSPSGTAISLADQLISNHQHYNKWVNEKSTETGTLGIKSLREEGVPGTHIITYQSNIDSISIQHEAKSRLGFAMGALISAEFLHGKKGVFTMQDVLKL